MHGVDDQRHLLGQLFRADRLVAGVPVEADARHADAAELHVDVGAGRHLGQALLPGRQHLVVAPGVAARSRQSPPRWFSDDRQVGDRPREVRQLRELREADAGRRARGPSGPAPARRPGSCPLDRVPCALALLSTPGVGSQVTVWRMPRKRFGLAAWSASRTGLTRSPSFRSACPMMRRCRPRGPVDAAGAHGSLALHELDLARPVASRPARIGGTSPAPR